jgi:hypothetical protein
MCSTKFWKTLILRMYLKICIKIKENYFTFSIQKSIQKSTKDSKNKKPKSY